MDTATNSNLYIIRYSGIKGPGEIYFLCWHYWLDSTIL